MDIELLLIGIIIIVLSYIVGVRKNTWLLAGYNEKRVKDKEKLAKMTGITHFTLGIIMILNSILDIKVLEYLLILTVTIVIIEVFYVNIKLVE